MISKNQKKMKKIILTLICFCAVLTNAQEITEQNLAQYMKRANAGDIEAQSSLGSYYFVKEQYIDALFWSGKAAEAGNATAQYDMGLAYERGEGVEINLKKAFEYYTKAAKQGHAGSTYILGFFYNVGKYVDVDLKKARQYYKKAAEMNVVYAQYRYGLFCLYGIGGKSDIEEGATNIEAASEQGHVDAIYIMGMMFLEGIYYDVDISQGMTFLEVAAKNNSSDAQYTLGVCYFYAKYGMKCSYAKAAKWFTMAAENGHFSAYNDLAYCYAYGDEELSVDFNKAHELIDKAIEKDPTVANFYDSKGEFYIMQGDKENAQKMWDKVMELNPDFHKSSTLYKSLYENNGVWIGKENLENFNK